MHACKNKGIFNRSLQANFCWRDSETHKWQKCIWNYIYRNILWLL